MGAGMPPGRYLTCVHNIRPEHAGTARALLARNAILAERCGIEPSLLTFAPAADLDRRRAAFQSLGLTTERISILNIFEHYREHGWQDQQRTGESLPDLRVHRTAEEALPSGTPWRTTYRLPGDLRTVFDYHRPDGSVYLRIPSFAFHDARSWPRRIVKVAADGEICGSFDRLGQWFRSWVRELAQEAERTFLFIDSRQLAPHLVPMPDSDIHVIYVLHNNHLQPPRRWDSPMTAGYDRVLHRVQGMDALVCLTERQREDIAQRVGATTNMYVVPNPVDLPDRADHPSRDPRRVTMLTRLEPQKRVEHAVEAFELVLRRLPDARLDIYGLGRLRDKLAADIDRRRLSGAVTLHGHDPDAKEELARSSVSLLTSRYEGYPLAVLESLARGCPVVAYDVKYGPREQLTDGVDGFLVEDGRVEELAARIVRLLLDSSLVARMGDAARRKGADHGADRYVADWARVLTAVVAAAPGRTAVRDASLTIRRLAVRKETSRRPPSAVAAVGRYGPLERLDLDGSLRVRGRGPGGLHDAAVELLAIGQMSGEVVSVPLEVRRRGRRLQLRSTVRLEDLFSPAAPSHETVRLLLRLIWRNSAHDQAVTAPAVTGDTSLQLAYELDGAVALTRLGESPGSSP